jgi:hypothetical protein
LTEASDDRGEGEVWILECLRARIERMRNSTDSDDDDDGKRSNGGAQTSAMHGILLCGAGAILRACHCLRAYEDAARRRYLSDECVAAPLTPAQRRMTT